MENKIIKEDIEEVETINQNHVKIDLGRQSKLFFAWLAIELLFFGVICNIHEKNIQENLIWLYPIYFKTLFGFPIILLFITCFLLTYKEDIYLYGFKNSLWMVPIVNLSSIIWYFIIYGISWDPIRLLFLSYQGYLNILILLIIHLSGAFCGMIVKKFVLSRQ